MLFPGSEILSSELTDNSDEMFIDLASGASQLRKNEEKVIRKIRQLPRIISDCCLPESRLKIYKPQIEQLTTELELVTRQLFSSDNSEKHIHYEKVPKEISEPLSEQENFSLLFHSSRYPSFPSRVSSPPDSQTLSDLSLTISRPPVLHAPSYFLPSKYKDTVHSKVYIYNNADHNSEKLDNRNDG